MKAIANFFHAISHLLNSDCAIYLDPKRRWRCKHCDKDVTAQVESLPD